MRVIIAILAVIAVVIALVLAIAATRPSTFTVQRSTTIGAPREKILPLIADFHNWPKWAPQDREDASMKRSFSGAPSGVGAVSEWTSTGSGGRGTITIAEATSSRIVAQADWQKPFVTRNVNEFVLEPVANGTRLTWTLEGRNLYMMKSHWAPREYGQNDGEASRRRACESEGRC